MKTVRSVTTRIIASVASLSLPLVIGIGPAMAAPDLQASQAPSACPSAAAAMFVEHFNSEHMGETLFGAGSITEDPSGWLAAHETLFSSMASRASGAC